MPDAPKASPFDPAVLDALAGLDFVARSVVEGYLAGSHRSPRRGSSAEFAQHRGYTPGDDVRFIDWRLFAKNERLMVKEFVEESNLVAYIAVDISGSMGFTSGASRTARWTKLDYARWVAAALAHLILGQRDIVAMELFDEQPGAQIPPRGGAPQRAAMLQLLEAAEPSGATDEGAAFTSLAHKLPQRGIAILISDFLGEIEPMFAGIEALVARGHEPILMQVLDPRELDFAFDGYLRLDDLEGGAPLKVDARVFGEAYREEVAAHQAALAKRAASLSLDFLPMTTDMGVDAALSTYLARRTARSKHQLGGR